MNILGELKKQFYWFGGLKLESESGTKYRSVFILYFSFAALFSLNISLIWSLLFYIHTPEEHAECVFFSLSIILLTLWHFIFIWKENEYWTFIDEIDKIIKTSKCDLNVLMSK